MSYVICTDEPLPIDPADCVALAYDQAPFFLLPPLTIEEATALAPPIVGLFALAWGIRVISRYLLKPY